MSNGDSTVTVRLLEIWEMGIDRFLEWLDGYKGRKAFPSVEIRVKQLQSVVTDMLDDKEEVDLDRVGAMLNALIQENRDSINKIISANWGVRLVDDLFDEER